MKSSWFSVVVICAGLLVSGLLTGCSSSPTPAPVKTSAPSEKEYGTLMASCLRAKGFDAKPIAAYGFEVDPHGQEAVLTKDENECRSKLGFHFSSNFSPQQLAGYYAAQLKVRTCLIEQGLAVTSPPSKQTFIDTFNTPGQWNPYLSASVKKLSPTKWNTLNSVCPQAIP